MGELGTEWNCDFLGLLVLMGELGTEWNCDFLGLLRGQCGQSWAPKCLVRLLYDPLLDEDRREVGSSPTVGVSHM